MANYRGQSVVGEPFQDLQEDEWEQVVVRVVTADGG